MAETIIPVCDIVNKDNKGTKDMDNNLNYKEE